MNRRRGAQKRAAPKTTPPSEPPKAAAAPPSAGESAEYVGKLAAAIADVTRVQDEWIAEIDRASREPGLMRDPAWQARSRNAARSMLAASAGLRIEPTPAAFATVEETLAQARSEAELATEGYLTAGGDIDVASIVAAVEHADRMGQLIQRAYGLMRAATGR